jgi:hypothetical protein
MLQRRFFPVALAVCALLSWMGMVEKADNVTHRVLDLVDGLSWSESLRPFHMPFPIDAMAFRPFSVLGLKTYVSAFGVGPPPLMLAWLKSVVCLLSFCLAARHWLRSIGLKRHAELASILPLGLSPVLFQAWYLPELDLLGAAATLAAGGILLQRSPLSRRQLASIFMLIGFALFLKESTAIVQISFLGASACMLFFRGLRKTRFKRHAVALAISGILWSIVVLPLMSSTSSSQIAQSTTAMRIGIVEHNLVQVLYLLSAPGAMLIVLGVAATQRESKKWLLKILCVCAIAVLLLLPIGHYYSHYEAVYFAPRWLGIGLALPLFAGLVLHTRNALREGPMAMASGQVLLVVTALSLAGVVAPNAREDMSSRVFVTLSPALFALSLESAHRFQKHFLDASIAFRHATKTLVVALVFYPVAHSFNYTMDWRARHAVDLAGKQNVAKINDGDLFLFNHYVEWLDPLGLAAAGASEAVDGWTFMHVPAWLPVDLYETARWIHPGPFSMQEAIETRTAHVYWMTPRTREKKDRTRQIEQLAWTRKNMGLFSPISDGLHNRPEDHQMTLYATQESPLEELMNEGSTLWEKTADFSQISTNLFDWPKRLIRGNRPIESLFYEGKLVALTVPEL